MLVFGICCWISEERQVEELRRCLESVKNYRVILVDGKWYDIEGESDLSIPSARELIKSYPNVTLIDSPNRHEWENRNKYFEACDDDDILIVLDTDEYVVIDEDEINIFDRRYSSFQVWGWDNRCGGNIVLNRGYMSPNKTRHKDRHNELWFDNVKLTFKGACPDGITIYHDKSYRSEEREKLMYTRNHLRGVR